MLAGLGHAGLQGSSAWTQAPLWAPSRVADPAVRELPMELGDDEIDAVIEDSAPPPRSRSPPMSTGSNWTPGRPRCCASSSRA
ncbi:hypothetical protein ACYAFX_19630 [Rhodococcus aetherivorans]